MGKVINILESNTNNEISLIKWSLRKSSHNQDSLTLTAKVNEKYYDFIEITNEGYFNILNVKDDDCGMNLDKNNYPKFLISAKDDVMDSCDIDDNVVLDITKIYEQLVILSDIIYKIDEAYNITKCSPYESEYIQEIKSILMNLKIIFQV